MQIAQHPIYKDYYATSNGDVISLKLKKGPYFMSQCNHGRGYKGVGLRIKGIDNTQYFLVHRFVWECFFGEIEEDMCIHHIDHDKTNNNIDNLQMVTDLENRQMAKEAKRYSVPRPNRKKKTY